MSRRVVLSARAGDDLRAIRVYIERENPASASAFMRKLQTRISSIGEQPRAAPLRPRLGENLRLKPAGQYIILYTVDEAGAVLVERVVHGARDLDAIDL